jgi:SAM-dependent methyltransferase
MYPANLELDDFNPEVFSQRRLPDRVHCRMVRCEICGLVRSDPRADSNTLARLYSQSGGFTAEESNLRRTYARYLDHLLTYGRRSGSLLEIGCGTGFFLVEAQRRGYVTTGVEPSSGAVAQAPSVVRDRIIQTMFQPGLFEAGSFDVICLFQVFDHVPDPGRVLDECHRILRPGGVMLALNHNIDAVINRLLGDRSPIIDIEHTFLYGPATMCSIFAAHRFQVCEVGRVWNQYSLTYLVRLLPLSDPIKGRLLRLLGATPAGRINLRLPLGNLYLVAQKIAGPEKLES